MEKIDLTKYVKSGEGANGSSYDCIADKSLMVKLYNPGYPTETITTELEVAKKVFELGVPSPQPGELVTDGERIGIRFRRIEGKRSYSRMLADEPERTEELSREFARYCKKLHSIQCPEGIFPEAKPQFLHLLEAGRVFTDAQKQTIADFISSAPDCGTALHGDLHIGNAISTLPKGAPLNEPHDVYFIDLGYFSRGCPLFDLGMTKTICLDCDEGFRQHDFHVTGETTKLVWDYFTDEYFDGKLTPQQACELVAPYQAVKLLLVEYNLGPAFPKEYVALIKETFGF